MCTPLATVLCAAEISADHFPVRLFMASSMFKPDTLSPANMVAEAPHSYCEALLQGWQDQGEGGADAAGRHSRRADALRRAVEDNVHEGRYRYTQSAQGGPGADDGGRGGRMSEGAAAGKGKDRPEMAEPSASSGGMAR